jgi:hypothetical protein
MARQSLDKTKVRRIASADFSPIYDQMRPSSSSYLAPYISQVK